MYPITHTVNIYRYIKSASLDVHSGSALYEAVAATIVPAGADIAAMYGQPAHAMYTIYMYQSKELLPGDKVVSGSDTWYVKGAGQIFNSYGLTVTESVLQKVYSQV